MKTALEYINCDFCGEDRSALFLEAESEVGQEKFKMVRCDNCGLIYLNPRPVKEIIGTYYPKESYYSYQDFKNKRSNYREWLKKISLEGYYNSNNVFKKLLSKLLVRNFLIVVPKEKKGRLLDIGCGSGEFLNQMKGFGWEVYGVEISPEAVDIGKGRGLDILCGELGGVDLKDDFFDVVVLSQTLEHVYSPGSYLEKIYRILKQDGILIIGVPNVNSLETKIFGRSCHALDVPRHLHFFTVASLRNYLEKYGFEVEKILSKKFSLPIQGIKTDLKNHIQNEGNGKSALSKIWMIYSVISRLFFMKISRFLFGRDKADELGFYIAFYARKPASEKKA